MPEFKEEVTPSVESEVSESVVVEIENGDKVVENEHVHYTLKRGRIPAQKQKKSANSSIAGGVGEVDADAVKNDAIGVGNNNKSVNVDTKKSTEVVENISNKHENRHGNGSSKSQTKGSCKSGKCSTKSCGQCKKSGGFFQKILQFFGLCKEEKKVEQSNKQTRSYRRRNHSQRRRRPKNEER